MRPNRYTPDEYHKVKRYERYKDTRKAHQLIWAELKRVEVAIIVIIFLTLLPVFLPHTVWLSTITLPIITSICIGAPENKLLPLKLPEELGKVRDPHDSKPGNRWSYNYAQGTVMLGNELNTDKELWLSGGDLLTHALVIGTTGAGKTVALVGLSAATAFCRGGGLIYIDAKAGPDLQYEMSALCRIFGREDDLRVINYSLAGSTTKSRPYKVLSNTTSPFSHGTDSQAVTTLTDTMSSGGDQNKFFENRAIALLKILMPVLCELRDIGVLAITPNIITEYMSVRKFMELAKNKIVINGEERPGIEIRENIRRSIETFLKQLAVDFNKSPDEQDAKVNEQFSYAEGYFALSMANFAGTFAHIYGTVLAESDFVDVVLHNRILIVLIPAMQQSAEETSSLGKIVLASLKIALSQGLGGDNAGDYDDVVGSLPVDLRVPTLAIIDEYPAIVVEGFATAATQGRSVGMICVFSGQDFPGFTRASEPEADQIFGSTRLKVLLATEDAGVTLKKFQELAGKEAVAVGNGWEKSNGYVDAIKSNVGATIAEVDRIDIKEINEQGQGEAHVFHRGKVIRSNLFYSGIKDSQVKDNFRYNQLLPIEYPDHSIVEMLVTMRRQVNYLENIAAFDRSSVDNSLQETIGYWAEKGGCDWPTKILLHFNEGTEPKATTPTEAPEGNEIQSTVDLLNEIDQIEEPQDEAPSGGIDLDSLPGPLIDNQNDDLEEAIFSTTSSSADIYEQVTNNEYNKILSQTKNSWVFTALSNISGNQDRCDNIVETLVELNSTLGMDETDSRIEAITQMNTIANEVQYPSQPVEAKPDDADDLFKAIEELTKQQS